MTMKSDEKEAPVAQTTAPSVAMGSEAGEREKLSIGQTVLRYLWDSDRHLQSPEVSLLYGLLASEDNTSDNST